MSMMPSNPSPPDPMNDGDGVPEWLSHLGVNLGFMLAGFFGSLFHVRGLSKINAMVTMVIGTASANYLTPLVIDIFHVTEHAQYAVAFFVGTLGLRSTELVLSKFGKPGKETK
jgi:hypothetical protein